MEKRLDNGQGKKDILGKSISYLKITEGSVSHEADPSV